MQTGRGKNFRLVDECSRRLRRTQHLQRKHRGLLGIEIRELDVDGFQFAPFCERPKRRHTPLRIIEIGIAGQIGDTAVPQ